MPFNNLTADFSYSPTTIYEGNNVQFTDMSAISTGTIDSWLWSIDGGFTFYTGQNFTYTFTNAGNYTILHKVISSLGDIDTISKLITVLPASAPIAKFSAPDSIYISASVQFINTSSSSGIIVAFSWDFGDGMQGSFLQNPVHTYALAGVYAVRLIVIDNLGQGDTVTKMIRVLPPAGVQIKALCPAVDSTQLFCYFPGANYQWQLSTDSGITFSNISDNTYYIGSNERFIQLKNIPSSWAGYQYRCIAGSNIDVIYKIVFTNLFTGNGDNTWENPANWNCGNLPDANTDIVIPAGSTVVLNSNASCRTITVSPGASFTINPGFTLTITH
ncbi:MAG: PKD domain-containing protein [Chitinophagaceae bacterium]|nr:PKD domain-containing protein [Chitinophagaceae bacterium]